VIIGKRNGQSACKCHRPRIESFPSKNGGDDQQNDNCKDNTPRAHDAYALPPMASALRSIGSRRSATPVAA
jgi:hypothetical protein